jgi:hypothetical protein
MEMVPEPAKVTHLRAHVLNIAFRIEHAARIDIHNRITPRTPLGGIRPFELLEITRRMPRDPGPPRHIIKALKS